MLPATLKKTETSSIVAEQRCRRFSLEEIHAATQTFNEAFVIGSGGFGKVYKGYIKDGSTTVVAIKRSHSSSNQATPQFKAEVEMLSTIRHCNLVSLIGYCNEGREMALVYDYMPHGTLADHLYKTGTPLSWQQLLKLCIGAARGLDYLHTGTGTQHRIIHRDVKSSNVLLDKDFAAKISDFGLAKIGPTNQTFTHVSTGIKGTFGYIDPSYSCTGQLTRKSDVYAFGVILLEVICGRPAVDRSLDEEKWGLAPWAKDRIKEGRLNHIIDSRLRGQISSKCLKDFATIACHCLHKEPKQRLKMADVVSGLEDILSLQQRLDASIPARKIIDKILLCFWPKFEWEASNFILAGPSSGGSKPIDVEDVEVNSAMVIAGKGKVLSGLKDVPHLSHTSDIEGTISSALAPTSNGSSRSMAEGKLMLFSFNVLETATRKFHPDGFLGEGYFGAVFKAWIDEKSLTAAQPGTGTTVAVVVKRKNQVLQSHPEWLAEVNCLGLINHPNLVKLIGYCPEDDHKLLVYEFMQRGDLENYLFKRRSYSRPLSWNLRIKVALGAAKGLAYLHSREAEVICHDFRSSGILIDSNCNARISNFGVVKDGQVDSRTHAFTQAIGTNGYAAPEYVATGQFSTSSNMYSFGVVLLEILTGKRCIDQNSPPDEQILVEFAKPYFTKERILEIIDPHRDEHYSSVIAIRAAELAMKCLSQEPTHRPTADEVVKELEQLQGFH